MESSEVETEVASVVAKAWTEIALEEEHKMSLDL